MFQDKIVFVTGGAQGIGRALVQSFVNEEAKVVFCDKDKEKGEELAQSTGALFKWLDLSDHKLVQQTMEEIYAQYGDVDILINNAGLSRFMSLTRSDTDDFDYIIASNLRPVYLTSRSLAIHRERTQNTNKYGRIVNIASTRYLMSEPGSEAYAASKGGIVSLTHALAISLSEYNITVNAISPGWIEVGDYTQLTPEDHRQHPSGRVGTPEDIVRAVHFLCHPENDFINGENLIIDGGMTRKMIYM